MCTKGKLAKEMMLMQMYAIKKMSDFVTDSRKRQMDDTYTNEKKSRALDMGNYAAYSIGVLIEPFIKEYRKEFPQESKAFDQIESFQTKYREFHGINAEEHTKKLMEEVVNSVSQEAKVFDA